MFNVISAGVRPEIPDNMSPAYRALMESCWQTEAEARCRNHTLRDMRVDLITLHPVQDAFLRQSHVRLQSCLCGSMQ